MNSRRLLRSTAAVLTAAAGAALLGACASPGAAQAVTTVRVATQTPHANSFVPFQWAEFAPEGLEFEIVPIQDAADMANAIVSGSVDFGISGITNGITNSAAGRDIQVVAPANDRGAGVVGEPWMTSIADLAGQTVAFGAVGHEALLRMELELYGLDFDEDLDMVFLPLNEHALALQSGRVNAFVGTEAQLQAATREGFSRLSDLVDGPAGGITLALHTRASLAEEDPELVQAVVDTHIQAVQAQQDDPQAWGDLVIEVHELEHDFVHPQIPFLRPRWDVDALYFTQVAALGAEMYRLGMIEAPLDVNLLLNDAFTAASEFRR